MRSRIFISFGFFTILAVYLLILVGGVVRASGSGMGCPDWPKCFGMWIPPTSVNELPIDYKEVFGAKLKGEVEFNVYKTWTEYLNRLLGVSIGILIFITFVSSIFSFWRLNKKIVALTFAAFVLVGFQGWLGSRVVSTELLPWMVTTHLLVAVVIVLFLIWAIVKAKLEKGGNSIESVSSMNFAIGILAALSFVQFILGTRVRESVDHLNQSGAIRSEWVNNLGGGYILHIIIAIIVLIAHLLAFRAFKSSGGSTLRKLLFLLVATVGASFLTGVLLGLFDISPYSQPLHLTFATVILGIQFAIYLVNNKGNVSLQ